MKNLRNNQWVYHKQSMVQGKVLEIKNDMVVVELYKTLPTKTWKMKDIGLVEELYVETHDEE